MQQRTLLQEPSRIVLDDTERNCRVRYEPGFLAPSSAESLLTSLRTDSPWERESPRMFGRVIQVRRATCSFGERGFRYRYSGLDRIALPWPPAIASLLPTLRSHCDAHFNYVLCNLYEDGDVGLGWHADDEDDLVPDAAIASISLGAERDFVMRLGGSGPATVRVSLAHGSLLVMEGRTQRHYQHAVPKRKTVSGVRINLTFRCVRATV